MKALALTAAAIFYVSTPLLGVNLRHVDHGLTISSPQKIILSSFRILSAEQCEATLNGKRLDVSPICDFLHAEFAFEPKDKLDSEKIQITYQQRGREQYVLLVR